MNPQSDPGSLSRLHDIVVESPVSWWPLAPAWYVLAILVLCTISFLLMWAFGERQANWYRRAGLAELDQLQRDRSHDAGALPQLAELLKRVALVAYPRTEVASLTGAAWLRFLDQTAQTTDFSAGPGQQLAGVYRQSVASPTPELWHLARSWIRHHRRHVPC